MIIEALAADIAKPRKTLGQLLVSKMDTSGHLQNLNFPISSSKLLPAPAAQKERLSELVHIPGLPCRQPHSIVAHQLQERNMQAIHLSIACHGCDGKEFKTKLVPKGCAAETNLWPASEGKLHQNDPEQVPTHSGNPRKSAHVWSQQVPRQHAPKPDKASAKLQLQPESGSSLESLESGIEVISATSSTGGCPLR